MEFKKGTGCKSDILPIESSKTGKLHAEKDKYDGKCKSGEECDFNIQVKLKTDTDFTDIDPKLQIEDARLLTDWVRGVLVASATALLVVPLLLDYLKRRRATAQN